MIKGSDTFTSAVTVTPEPGSRHTDEDRALQARTVRALFVMVERLAYLVDAIADMHRQAGDAASKLPAKDPLRARLLAFAQALDAQRGALVSSQRGEGVSGEQKPREEIGLLYGNVNSYDGRPTQSQLDRMGVLEAELAAAITRFDAATAKEGAALSAQLAGKKLAPMTTLTREVWEKRRPS
jgi:hypothetical protein